mgnify:FL=1
MMARYSANDPDQEDNNNDTTKQQQHKKKQKKKKTTTQKQKQPDVDSPAGRTEDVHAANKVVK